MRLRYIFSAVIMVCLVLNGCSTKNMEPAFDSIHNEIMDERVIFTAEDIYLLSFECGYISQNEKPGDSILIIENDDQLAFAETRYGLALPEGIQEDEIWHYNTSFIDAFQEMKSMYSLDEYTYVVEYRQSSSGMYNYNVDKLVLDGERLYFELDDEAKNGNDYEWATDDMSGWCYLAALPKDILDGKNFTTAVRPDADDITQNELYICQTIHDVYDSSLYELYGDTVYVIKSSDEYEMFISKADALTKEKNPFRTMTVLSDCYDYEKVSVIYIFFERDSNGMWYKQNAISIENGNVFVDYEIVKNDGYNLFDETKTCIQRIVIPAGVF